MFRRRKKTKMIAIIALFLPVIAAILYRLADHYLIEDVEAVVAPGTPAA